MINIGIIGYGFMGHVHCERLQQLEGYRVEAVCDIEEGRMTDAPEGIRRYTDMQALLQNPAVHTVIIAIPNHLHLDAVLLAAKAGKNIICEKPAAMSVQEFDQMTAAAKEAGVLFTVHHQRRWDRDFRTAKEVYDQKSLGQPYTVQSKLYGFNGNMHDWHVYKKYGGGMLYDWGVHLIDQMLWMIQSGITSVFADVRNIINEEVDDYFKILLRFENGVTGEIELGTYFLTDREKWFERHWFIGGDKGSAYIDGFAPEGKIVRTARLLENAEGKPTMTASGPTRSFGPPPADLLLTEALPETDSDQLMFFENYRRAVKGEEELTVKPEQVRAVLQLMDAIRQSAETGRSVEMI